MRTTGDARRQLHRDSTYILRSIIHDEEWCEVDFWKMVCWYKRTWWNGGIECWRRDIYCYSAIYRRWCYMFTDCKVAEKNWCTSFKRDYRVWLSFPILLLVDIVVQYKMCVIEKEASLVWRSFFRCLNFSWSYKRHFHLVSSSFFAVKPVQSVMADTVHHMNLESMILLHTYYLCHSWKIPIIFVLMDPP